MVQVAILAIIHLLGLLLGVVLGPLAVDEAQPLGLSELVDLEARGGREQLLCQPVVDGVALRPLPLLPDVHGLECSARAEELVGQLALARRVIAVHLVASVSGVTCVDESLVCVYRELERVVVERKER